MSDNLGWKEAILEVLGSADAPMGCRDIADQIAERELRTDLGFTPANSVAAIITISIHKEKHASPFVRVARGVYSLRSGARKAKHKTPAVESESTPTAGVVNALGMFWERSRVSWAMAPKILGQQQAGSKPVDFTEQKGVYLLHDSQGVVYVGRTTDQNLGRRLYQHTIDRLNGRWDRFSWFGIYPVDNKDGARQVGAGFNHLSIDTLITTMEAVLIEGLEPRQNRKRGDDFQAVEFLQVDDPQVQQQMKVAILKQMMVAAGMPST